MNYLLDTHTFLWAAFSPRKLSNPARKAIRSAENQIYLSSISFWEISIKYALGKIELEGCSPEDMPSIAAEMSLEIIQPTAAENASFYKLPRAEHKDPFDRMIIRQAIEQQLRKPSSRGATRRGDPENALNTGLLHRLRRLAMTISYLIRASLTLISKDKNFPAYKKLGLTILW